MSGIATIEDDFWKDIKTLLVDAQGWWAHIGITGGVIGGFLFSFIGVQIELKNKIF